MPVNPYEPPQTDIEPPPKPVKQSSYLLTLVYAALIVLFCWFSRGMPLLNWLLLGWLIFTFALRVRDHWKEVRERANRKSLQ